MGHLATAVAVAAASLVAAGCSGTDAATPPSTEPATTGTTPGLPDALAAGKAVFRGVSGCGGCHALADAGATGSLASDLDQTKPSEARVRELVVKGKDAMPPYEKQLSEQEIADVAAYVAAVAGRQDGSGAGPLGHRNLAEDIRLDPVQNLRQAVTRGGDAVIA